MATGGVGGSLLLARLRRLAEKIDRALGRLGEKRELPDLSDHTRRRVAEEMVKLEQSRMEIGRLIEKLEEMGESAGRPRTGRG